MPCWCRGQCPHMAEPNRELAAGRQARAETLLRRNLSEAPWCVEANIAIADIMSQSNRAAFAEIHLARALKAGGHTPRVQLEIARNLRLQARPVEAAAAFEAAAKMAPKDPHAWGGLIGTLESDNKIEAACEAGARACTLFPDPPPAIRMPCAMTLLARKDHAGAIALLEKPNITPAERLLRGRAKEAAGDYAGAWADWTAGKLELAEKQGHLYWREHFQTLFSGLYEISQPARYKLLAPAPELEIAPGPFFVTGFPRSGTTMLETALASHSRIIDGDEVMGVSDVVQTLPKVVRSPLPYPHALMATTLGDNPTVLTDMRDLYWRKLHAKLKFPIGPASEDFVFEENTLARPVGWPRYFTDKMPMNDLHLPLIRLLFPRAPFIYIRRHPLDIFVSTMSHMLTSGGHYAESLETMAEHYAGADAILQHYKATLPIGPFKEVKYEDLVADLAGELAACLAIGGLELEPACLAFHENPRHSHTISQRQVKQPLYTSSVARFKNFLPFMEPALRWIEPILKRENYSL